MNRPLLHNLNTGDKLRDTVTGRTYRVTHVNAAEPSVRVATEDGTRGLTASEFTRMEYAN